MLVKKAKPNFKILGKKAGALMKAVAEKVTQMSQEDIRVFENDGRFQLELDNGPFQIDTEDAEISSQDIPGWEVNTMGKITVALDIDITSELRKEGLARELVNRIQNLRKEKGLDVTDRISLIISEHPDIRPAIEGNMDYICNETLISTLSMVSEIPNNESDELELEDQIRVRATIKKV
jgi:isoleucyl-tRNA synthetase